MPAAKKPRFPRIIRLFDRIFAADPGPKAFWLLSWMGGGFVLLFIVPSQLLREEMSRLMAGDAQIAAELAWKSTLWMLAGFILLATFYGAFFYWVFAAGIPRKRAGLGTEYNPVKFARMAEMLREIGEWRDATDWRKYESRKHATDVQAYEAWLSASDADSYKAWRAYRTEQGV